MRVFLLILGLAFSGCLAAPQQPGQPAPLKYDFHANVKLNPAAPVAGRNVSLSLDLLSRSSEVVVIDVMVTMLRPDRSVMNRQVWKEVKFRPEEVWTLSQGFIPRNDEKGTLSIVVEVRETGTDKLLWSGNGPTTTFKAR